MPEGVLGRAWSKWKSAPVSTRGQAGPEKVFLKEQGGAVVPRREKRAEARKGRAGLSDLGREAYGAGNTAAGCRMKEGKAVRTPV